MKVARQGGSVLNAAPEFEDCARLAADAGRLIARSPSRGVLRITESAVDLPLTVHYQFRELTKMVENWQEEIFNYFDERVTNSFTECANGLAKITNRTGRGHSFAVIRFKVLFAHKMDAFKRRSIRSRMAVLGVPFSTFDDSIWTDS